MLWCVELNLCVVGEGAGQRRIIKRCVLNFCSARATKPKGRRYRRSFPPLVIVFLLSSRFLLTTPSLDWLSIMTIPHPPPLVDCGTSHIDSSERPAKRAKTVPASDISSTEDGASVRRHPLGVRPSGNAFTSSVNVKHAAGSFSLLPDELIASFLESLEPQDLLRLGGTCRALHGFTRNEELWRTLFVE